MDYIAPRNRFVDWLRQQLIGPAQPDGVNLVGTSPMDRYPLGVLHPVMPGGAGTDPASPNQWEDNEEEATVGDQEVQNIAQPTRKRRYVPPSAVGFSPSSYEAIRACKSWWRGPTMKTWETGIPGVAFECENTSAPPLSSRR